MILANKTTVAPKEQNKGDMMSQSASSESIAQKIGLFRVPGLLVKLSTKCLPELDSVWSPTSPLDYIFSNFGGKSPRSPAFDGTLNQKSLLGERVGLGLVDSFSDESSTTFGNKKVLLGSEMRISNNIGSKNHAIAPIVGNETSCSELSPQVAVSNGFCDELGSSMSIDEIVNSEDYTCIVSRGPNPKTTHIFGDRMLTKLDYFAPVKTENRGGLPAYPNGDILSFCCFCNEKLEEGKNIYLYLGEKAFCSTECRINFIEEEMEDEHMADSEELLQLIR